MKKTLALLLALVMLFSLAACGAAEPAPAEPAPAATEEPAAETVMFTDSCGREVELPANITKIAPSGTVATMILAAFAPEELVCVGTQVSENQVPYLYDGIADLPVIGQLYGGKAINKFIIFTMYFGGGMIPNYILMVSLGLRDTVASFILPGMISTYYVILMRSFFLTLPRELEEAGEIDGLDLWGVFWRIAIPLSKPIIATMTLFYVVQYWNDWFDAFLYLDTTTKWPVAYYLRQLISSASGTSADAGDAMQIASNIKSCAMVLTSAPIICIYPFIQKYFVQGMMLGGVKG